MDTLKAAFLSAWRYIELFNLKVPSRQEQNVNSAR